MTEEMIADLSSRFLVNLPRSELLSFDRIFDHLQCASWFYTDHYAKRPMSTRNFCQLMFNRSALLRPFRPHFDVLYASFQDYLTSIHVYGCLIWSRCRTHVLLVRGPTGFWSFPKGKREQHESGRDCASREVLEETGLDVCSFLDPSTRSITRHIHKRVLTMYVLSLEMGPVVQQTPLDRTEITAIRWVPTTHITDHNTYPTVIPFLTNNTVEAQDRS